MPMNIMIADDHRLFRNLISSYLKKNNNIHITGEAENGEQLLYMMERVKTDIVLLDLNMPKMSGLEALDLIKRKFKSVKVLILSMHDTEGCIAQCIEAGAAGFLHKNAEPEEIQVALDSVYSEGFYLNDKAQKALLTRVITRKNTTPLFESDNISLSHTEMKVLKYLCQGFTSSEISEKVFIAPRSVEGVRQKLIRKTNAKNAIGLTIFAIKNGLVDISALS